jgi:hypothetical protein
MELINALAFNAIVIGIVAYVTHLAIKSANRKPNIGTTIKL